MEEVFYGGGRYVDDGEERLPGEWNGKPVGASESETRVVVVVGARTRLKSATLKSL